MLPSTVTQHGNALLVKSRSFTRDIFQMVEGADDRAFLRMHPPPIAQGTEVVQCLSLSLTPPLYAFAMETSPEGRPPRTVKILLQALDVFIGKVLVLTLDIHVLEESIHTRSLSGCFVHFRRTCQGWKL